MPRKKVETEKETPTDSLLVGTKVVYATANRMQYRVWAYKPSADKTVKLFEQTRYVKYCGMGI